MTHRDSPASSDRARLGLSFGHPLPGDLEAGRPSPDCRQALRPAGIKFAFLCYCNKRANVNTTEHLLLGGFGVCEMRQCAPAGEEEWQVCIRM